MANGSETLFANEKGPWWVKFVTYWGLPGVIIAVLFWRDIQKDKEDREDNKSVVDVVKENTKVMTEFKGVIGEMKDAMRDNTRSRDERRRLER